MIDIKSALSELWGARIDNLVIDIANHIVSLIVSINNDEVIAKKNIKFIEVSAICWINDWSDIAQINNWDYIDLTSIITPSKAQVIFTGTEAIEKYKTSPNISIEIWNSILLITTNRIIIDDNEYSLTQLKSHVSN